MRESSVAANTLYRTIFPEEEPLSLDVKLFFIHFLSLSCFLAPRALFYKPCSTIWHLLITVSFSSYRHCAVTQSDIRRYTVALLVSEAIKPTPTGKRLDPRKAWIKIPVVAFERIYIVGAVDRYKDPRQNVLSCQWTSASRENQR